MGSHQLPVLNNHDTFEDAICDLFNCIESTNTFKRFGRSGQKQKGIDLFSSQKDCAVQCKKKDLSRNDSIIRKELINDIRRDVEKVSDQEPDIVFKKLIFVSNYKDHTEIDEACEKLKNEWCTDFEIIYWGWDTLQSKFLDYPDLIKKYWPSFIINTETAKSLFKRNLDLKKRIDQDFGAWFNFLPENRKLSSKMILRVYDGKQYPDMNKSDEYGEYSWFRVEIKALYTQGVEFVLGIDKIEVFEDQTWCFITESNTPIGRIVDVAKVGQVNFTDIVGYDINGDQIYNCPHFFCEFKYKGTPFEKLFFYDIKRPSQVYSYENMRR